MKMTNKHELRDSTGECVEMSKASIDADWGIQIGLAIGHLHAPDARDYCCRI